MKKITLSIGLLAGILTSNAQDTTCVMIRPNEVINFNYQTNEIIDRYDNKNTIFIEIGYQEIVCLHLFDEKLRVRKIITTFFDGTTQQDVLDSKDNIYYSPRGAVKVSVGKPKFIIAGRRY